MNTYPELGWLNITTQRVETGSGDYRMITDAKWEGPPVTRLDDELVENLPDYAFSRDGELVQIGQYVMRRTGVQHFASRSEYYHLVDGGEAYWLLWRAMQGLDVVWRRVILTMAVWRLAEWPSQGCIPSWNDVMKRWKK